MPETSLRVTPRIGLTEQVGRLLMIGWEGEDPSEAISLIERFHPAGLIFFKRNFTGSYESVKQILHILSGSAVKILGRPILLALDHEGGRVNRLPLDETTLPSSEELSKIYLSEGIKRIMDIAYQAALHLKTLGFNLNLAPVLDLLGENAYIGDRSFGSDPEMVGQVAGAFWEGHFKAGIMTCAKHFPGLGSSISDPHKDLPVIIKPLEELWETDGKPFRELICLGVSAIMTTHALFRAVDPVLPATYSEKIVNLLKKDYGFKGPVLTDDLEMGALDGLFSPGESALRAVIAGHDLVLICKETLKIEHAAERLKKAVVDHEISPARLREAHTRLKRLMNECEL